MSNRKKRTGTRRARLTRRTFLGGAGVGAAAGAVGLSRSADSAGGAGSRGPAAPELAGAATRTDRFSRMFALPPFADPDSEQVRAALIELGRPGGLMDAKDPLEEGPVALIARPELSPNNLDNPTQTAGVTFFGQFLDHDLTFDVSSPLGRPAAPQRSVNGRTPSLDLDSVYGGGPAANPELYDPEDRAKFLVESGGLFEDLPRAEDGTAVIADPRNDEHLMLGGMHAAFLLCHNRAVDELRARGVPGRSVFARARQLVTWHYQWIIVHEFLPLVAGEAATADVLRGGRRYYRPRAGRATIPVEFQGAVYRMGHSMVRPSYRANLHGDQDGDPATGAPAFFGFIFDPAAEGAADPADLRGGARAPRRFIGWQTFFDFNDSAVRANKRIDTHISSPLFRLPLATIPSHDPPISLPQRNLLRHLTWSLPSGQRIAREMRVAALRPEQLEELAPLRLGLERSTPLWYYTLKEAELVNEGKHLGPMGGRLVAEVFIGLLQLDRTSYLAANPRWRPTMPSRVSGTFDLVDLLTYAGVAPADRGQ